jgi:class 3 adenylate cyclase
MRCMGCGFDLMGSGDCERCGARQSPNPDNVAQSIAALPDDAERRQLTVVFCDLAGSTALSERVDPEDLRNILREYQHRCAIVIRRFRGHVAQYLGDGLMAYFGYPIASDDDSTRALESGLELVKTVSRMRREFNTTISLSARVGIHSGSVVLGNMGDDSLPQRLAVGTTPNLAARVQMEAEANSVFITEATHRLVEGYFECEPVGARQLKGVSQPVRLYRVLRRGVVASRMDLSRRRGLSPFVGREREMAWLMQRWQARGPNARGVAIVGEPGIGKSRLAYEFSRSLPDIELIDCSAVQHHESDALFPVLRYLERWVEGDQPGGDTAVGVRLAERLESLGLRHCAAELNALLASATDAVVSQAQLPSAKQYQRSIELLGDFFRALIERQPSILMLEDVQWLDPSTQFFLQVWAERSPPLGFVLATARRTVNLDWIARAGLEVHELPRLDALASRTIATRVARQLGADLTDEAVEQLLERAEGVPLFIEESTRACAGSQEAQGSAREPTSEPPGIPETLRDSLASRLDRLGPARRLAQLASVIGREFPVSWLRELCDPDTELENELSQLVETGVIYAVGAGTATYAFSHALIRDAAYLSLTRTARSKYHRQTAEIIVGRHPEVAARKPLVIAHHFAEAGDVAAAATQLLRAAKRALTGAAFVEAIAIAQRGLDLIRRSTEPSAHEATEIELLTTLGLTLISTRGYSSPEVEDVYARAAQLCERQGDVPLHVLYGVWAVRLVRSDSRRVTGLAKVLERRLEDSPTADESLVAHACLGVRAFYRAKLTEAREHFTAAAAAVTTSEVAAQHERLLSRYGFEGGLSGVFWLVCLDAHEGKEAAARAGIRTGWELAQCVGDPYTECQVALYLASVCRELDDTELGGFFLERALRLSLEHDFAFWHALSLCVQSWLLAEQGESADKALDAISTGLGALDLIGAVVNRAYFQSYLVDVHLRSGRLNAAIQAAEEGLSMCREGLGPMFEPELLRQRGVALLRSQNDQDAEEHLRAALAGARLQGMRLLELRASRDLACMLRSQGRQAEAHEIFEKTCRAWPDGESSTRLVAARRVVEAAPTPSDAQDSTLG